MMDQIAETVLDQLRLRRANEGAQGIEALTQDQECGEQGRKGQERSQVGPVRSGPRPDPKHLDQGIHQGATQPDHGCGEGALDQDHRQPGRGPGTTSHPDQGRSTCEIANPAAQPYPEARGAP